jgi:hypothetical protein
VDGAPPPSTIDDNAGRSVTQALPDAQLAPLAQQRTPSGPNSATPATPVSAEAHAMRGTAVLSQTQAAEATRFGALPTLALPEQPGPAPKVLTAEKVKEQHPSAPPPVLTEMQESAPGPIADGRSGGLSPAAVAVLAVAAIGVVAILVGAYVILTAPDTKTIPDDGKNVVELKERDKPTTKEQQEKHQEVVDQLGDAPPDPVARDKALARAKAAMGNLDPLGALAAFDEAINADPTSAEAHYGRATIAMQQQDWRTARDHIERAMALDPKYARLLQGQYALAKKRAAEQP